MSDDEAPSLTFSQMLEQRKSGFAKRPTDEPTKQVEARRKVVYHRASKHAPQEISSKFFVKEKREISNRREIRDPRFESLCGTFNEDLYRKSYKFIEDQQEGEIKLLKNMMKKEKDEVRKRHIQADMTRLMQQKLGRERRDKMLERKREYKKKEQEAVAKGKTPYYLKRSVLKQEELKDRFEQLSKKGKLIRYMEKKRKRNAERDSRYLPKQRMGNDDE